MEEEVKEFSPETIDVNGVRCAVRFPLRFPVRILAGDMEWVAITENISASGVLFQLDKPIPLEATVEFLLQISADQLFGEVNAAVHCVGRVVRSYSKGSICYAAAVIDEYRFQ